MDGLALSTSWKSQEVKTAEELIASLDRFEIAGVELEYRIPQAIYGDLRKALKAAALPVISVHNFFPLPEMFPRNKASGDLFLLSDPDREERYQAVQWTIRTLEHANDLEAQVVVLHCGKVDIDPELDTLIALWNADRIDTDEARAFIEAKLVQREEKKSKYLDALLWSLDRLVLTAEKYNIYIGLENRAHYHELPGPQEFSILFAEFDGAPLGYWHDTGHAHVNTIFGFTGHATLLNRYKDRLIGIHLHDAKGIKDHLPPGSGEIAFAEIGTCLREGIPRVVELKPGTTDEEVADGLKFLNSILNAPQTNQTE